MNDTSIEWVHRDPTKRRSWNPITGCLRGCDYCYARSIAHHFTPRNPLPDDCTQPGGARLRKIQYRGQPFKYGFTPTFHPYRLDEPATESDVGVFVGSMADMFGPWVPDSWITQVFDACGAAPTNHYWYLTKYPTRLYRFDNDLAQYSAYDCPPNWWFGHSSDGQSDGGIHCSGATRLNRWVSLEPLLVPVTSWPAISDHPRWVVVGPLNQNRKPVIDRLPEKGWVLDIRRYCADHGIPLFEKPGLELLDIELIQQWPEGVNV